MFCRFVCECIPLQWCSSVSRLRRNRLRLASKCLPSLVCHLTRYDSDTWLKLPQAFVMGLPDATSGKLLASSLGQQLLMLARMLFDVGTDQVCALPTPTPTPAPTPAPAPAPAPAPGVLPFHVLTRRLFLDQFAEIFISAFGRVCGQHMFNKIKREDFNFSKLYNMFSDRSMDKSFITALKSHHAGCQSTPKPGSVVQISGLKNSPEYNGKMGKVVKLLGSPTLGKLGRTEKRCQVCALPCVCPSMCCPSMCCPSMC
jgi:hypothetical protein